MVMLPNEFYKSANLRDNPFRSNPTFASDPRARIWVGYEKQKRQFVKYLQRSLADQIGNANFMMMYGDYGTGKSHALLWAQNLILHEQVQEFDSVCYCIPTLRKDKGKLTFAGAFTDDLIARSELVRDVQTFHQFLGEAIISYRKANAIKMEVPAENIIEMMIPAIELNQFAKQLYSCQTEAEIHQFLAPPSLTDYQAMIIFTRLVNLFVYEFLIDEHDARRFKKGAYLFIDELDDLRTASPKDAREVNDILRHIYDFCPNCFCMVIALSANISEFSMFFMDYVLSRIQRQIELQVLDKDDAVAFVREILNNNRADPEGQQDFFPFEEGAIDGIASQLTEITPRKIVNAMQQVIEEVRLSGHNPDDGLVSLQYLDDELIIEEVLGDGGIA